MKLSKGVAAVTAILSAISLPGVAQADVVTENAENIRKLNIMLMVTSLRCRTGRDDFQADYNHFTRAHLTTLNRAGNELTAQLTRRKGARGAKMELDRIGVGMANSYGVGHPWLDCAALKQVTRDLAGNRDAVNLAATADDLLSSRPRGHWAAR